MGIIDTALLIFLIVVNSGAFPDPEKEIPHKALGILIFLNIPGCLLLLMVMYDRKKSWVWGRYVRICAVKLVLQGFVIPVILMQLNKQKLSETICEQYKYDFERELYFYGFKIDDAENVTAYWADT